MINIKDGKIFIELIEKEKNRLINSGVIFEIKPNCFKFLDKEEFIFLEVKK